MPYPAYKSSVVTFVVTFMAFFTALSFTFIIPPIMKRIVQEKKSGGKELMKMMGLPSWMNWFFHYLDAILTIMISLIIIVILVRSVFFYEIKYISKTNPSKEVYASYKGRLFPFCKFILRSTFP